MTNKEIRNKLAKTFPDYDDIYQTPDGLWNVKFEDQFEVTTITYKVDDSEFRYIGEQIVEQ